ncbi:MAG: MarC family protein [Puniceicoccales bacterium]|jgi:multiple antibiotic resistance protein|nr:MarC family protein [Puniceicoccales bacterium]
MDPHYLLTGVPLYLVLLIGPISGIAIIVALMPQKSIGERIQIITKACWVAYGMMLFFALTGNFLLQKLLGVSPEAFQIGGGLYLLSLSIDMLGLRRRPEQSPTETQPREGGSPEDTSYITPIAVPLITGPGVITAILGFRSQLEGCRDGMLFFLALSITMFAVFLCFYGLIRISGALTPRILQVLEKAAGLLTACLALDIVLDGLRIYLAHG